MHAPQRRKKSAISHNTVIQSLHHHGLDSLSRVRASLDGLAATTEAHFATRRNELMALREQQSASGWRLLTDAIAFLDGRVAAQVGQWRAEVSAEIGATTETELGLNTKECRLREVSNQSKSTSPLM